jgi:hypothetical protein
MAAIRGWAGLSQGAPLLHLHSQHAKPPGKLAEPCDLGLTQLRPKPAGPTGVFPSRINRILFTIFVNQAARSASDHPEPTRRFLVAVASVALAAVAAPVVVLAASACWPSVEASLTEAPAPSLLHIEVKMTLVGFISTGSEHGAKGPAGGIVD